MKLIPLTQGKFAQVDDSDFDFLNQWKWHAQRDKTTFYAIRSRPDENGKRPKMHRVLLWGFRRVDHRDNDGLNNQRGNLRPATQRQNCQNRKTTRNKTGYKGVTHFPKWARWVANIKHNGKQIYLGSFYSVEEAARAYDQAAVRLFGEFASLNFSN